MTIARVFSGYEQSDVASLQISDAFYRCYTYLVMRPSGTGTNGGVSLRARCMIEQGGAQQVELFDVEIANYGDDENLFIDCPKLIAVGTTFVACWLQQHDEATNLHMASLDINTIGTFGTAWDDHGSIVTHVSCLYDLVNINTGRFFEHHATDFIVVHRTDVDEFAVRRHDGFSWVDTDWITAYTTPADIAPSVLTALAHDELELFVLVTYQVDSGATHATGSVRTARFISTNGVNSHDTRSFLALPDEIRVSEATLERVATGTVALVIEYIPEDDLDNDDDYVRWLGMVELDSADTSQGSAEHACANLQLLSRAFALPGLSDEGTPTSRLFAAVGFKNMGSESFFEGDSGPTLLGGEWVQSLAFIADLDWTRWGATGDLEVRPFCVSQMPFTVVDTRVGGFQGIANGISTAYGTSTLDARRTNHLSHASVPPDFGPSIKSVTLALGAFGRAQNTGISTSAVAASGSRLLPVAAKVIGWEFNYEDPWIVWRDGREQPVANWQGIHELTQHQPMNVGRHLILGGGVPLIYDGVQVVELGFAWDPEIVDANGTLDGSDADGLAEGVYRYTAIYEWADTFGNVHRSGPAEPVSITLGDPGPDSNSVVLRIRTMTWSLRDNLAVYPDAHAINVVVYRTAANGSQFYRLHCLDNSFSSVYAVERTPVNDPTTWAITVTDTLPDDALTAVSDPLPWPILDVSGDPIPLEPNRIPAACAMAVFQERLALASLEDGDEIRLSLSLRRGLAPEFNDANVIRRDNMGPVVAMAAMDQQLVVFTPDRIYSVQGRVPNDTGSDGDLQFYLLAQGVGCVCARSVVVTAGEGIFFQSRKGYYQLDRGGATTFVGQDVEDYIRDAGTIRSATLMEHKHEIYLVCNAAGSGTPAAPVTQPVVLVYNYLHKMWSRHLPCDFVVDDERRSEAQHGLAWRGLDGEVSHVMLQQGIAGFERASTDSPYADSVGDTDFPIPIDIQTSWIKVAGIGGLHRIWAILLTLDKPNASQLTISIDYDHGGYGTADSTQSVVFASGTAMPLRIRTNVQKCTAIRVRITESGTVAQTENLSITAITLVAGVKRGHSQVPAAQIG